MNLVPPGSAVDTLDDPRWRPLRVVATLAEPIVTDTDPIHLDGPLSWCAYLAHQEHGGTLPPMTPTSCVDFALPLATWTAPPSAPPVDPGTLAADGTSTWGWACSAGHHDDQLQGVTHTRRPVPMGPIARHTTARVINTAAGPNKARNVPHATITTPAVTWWCLGDPDPLGELLGRLRSLGRLTHHGHGRILTITIVPDPDAATRWRWRQWPDQDATTPGACRAPYHHPTRRMPVTPLGRPPWA